MLILDFEQLVTVSTAGLVLACILCAAAFFLKVTDVNLVQVNMKLLEATEEKPTLIASLTMKTIPQIVMEAILGYQEKESPTGEIKRCVVFATTHVTKIVNDPESTSASDVKIAPVESNLPAASNCFIKNFRGRTIALGTYNNSAAPMEHAYSVCVEGIFDRGAELYDEDGTLGDIMLGQVIKWPKGSVQSSR